MSENDKWLKQFNGKIDLNNDDYNQSNKTINKVW